jgi:hypothetical protein
VTNPTGSRARWTMSASPGPDGPEQSVLRQLGLSRRRSRLTSDQYPLHRWKEMGWQGTLKRSPVPAGKRRSKL